MLLEAVDLNDKIGHLIIVDIKFNVGKANATTLTYNEIYTMIFQKQKIIDPTERSVLQLSAPLRTDSENQPLSFKSSKKKLRDHARKKITTLYLEYLNFFIKRVG